MCVNMYTVMYERMCACLCVLDFIYSKYIHGSVLFAKYEKKLSSFLRKFTICPGRQESVHLSVYIFVCVVFVTLVLELYKQRAN